MTYTVTETESVLHLDSYALDASVPVTYCYYFPSDISELESVRSANNLEELAEVEREDLAFVRTLRPRLAQLLTHAD